MCCFEVQIFDAIYVIIDANRSEGIFVLAREREMRVDACGMRETHADHTHRRFYCVINRRVGLPGASLSLCRRRRDR